MSAIGRTHVTAKTASRHWLSVWTLTLAIVTPGCAMETPEERKNDPVASGYYQTWDDVINRWIGQPKDKLFYELGPPTLHQKESSDGFTEMAWDMTIPSLPGQAREFGTLPLYGADVNCKLIFIGDQNGMIRSGRRIGCD